MCQGRGIPRGSPTLSEERGRGVWDGERDRDRQGGEGSLELKVILGYMRRVRP